MKKLFILFFSVIILVACTGKDDSAKVTNENNDSTVTQTEQQNNSQMADTNTIKEHEETSEGTSDSNYTELPIVFEKIGNDTFEQIVKTDNPNKRVILFNDEKHNKKYKSIYIKQNNRLKVIDLANDRLLFNDIL